MLKRRIGLLIILSLAFASCEDETPDPPPVDLQQIEKELIILNMGEAGSENSSISILDIEAGEVSNQVFANQNGGPVGDSVHTLHFEDDLIYIVDSGNGKIEIVNTDDFSSVRTLEVGGTPRDVELTENGDLLFSDLFEQNIQVINPVTAELVRTLESECTQLSGEELDCGNDQMIEAGHDIFIGNRGSGALIRTGALGTDIDHEDYAYLIADPVDLALDKNGNVWLVGINLDNPGNHSVYMFNPTTFNNIEYHSFLGELPYAASYLYMNHSADKVYFNTGEISALSIANGTYESRSIIYDNSEGLAINSFTVDAEEFFLYIAVTGVGSNPGEIIKIRINDGMEVARYSVGVVPSKLYLR